MHFDSTLAEMVRLKHRYLLVNILYPEHSKEKAFLKDAAGEEVPYALQFSRPSDDRIDAKLLGRLIRDGVSDLFGDYGSGMIASSLQGKCNDTRSSKVNLLTSRSQIFLSSNKYSDHPSGARSLPLGLVCSCLHHPST